MDNQPKLDQDTTDTATVVQTQPTAIRRISTTILVLVAALLLGYVLYMQLMLQPVADIDLGQSDTVTTDEQLTELEQLQQRMMQADTQAELSPEQAAELTERMNAAAPATTEQMAELEARMNQN